MPTLPPWGETRRRESSTVLNDNRSAIRAILLEVLAEFDQPRSWKQMPLPPQVDTSSATNRDERHDLRTLLLSFAAEPPATNAEGRVSDLAAPTARTNFLQEIEQKVARIEAAKGVPEQREAADALVIYLSSIVAAGRGTFAQATRRLASAPGSERG